jgi:uncharacterized protein HemX
MPRTYTGKLWNWTKQVDQPGQIVTHTLLLSCALLNPAVLLGYGGLYAGAAVADGVAATLAARREAKKKRHDQQERERQRSEQAERNRKEDERRRAEAEVARRKATREYKLAEAKRAYDTALQQIERDATFDATEKEAARLEAKARYLRRMNEVM